jgi:hypothetical protein
MVIKALNVVGHKPENGINKVILNQGVTNHKSASATDVGIISMLKKKTVPQLVNHAVHARKLDTMPLCVGVAQIKENYVC